MRLLHRGRRAPHAKTIRPAQPYLVAGAEQARRLRHNDVGTEHVLGVLVRDANGVAPRLLAQLGVSGEAVEGRLVCRLEEAPAVKIDPEALAALGIDFEVVREHVEQTFGSGALERTSSACISVCPRLKLALAYALDRAAGRPLGDEHVLLGMLSVPDSVAARVLDQLGVTLEAAEAIVEAAS